MLIAYTIFMVLLLFGITIFAHELGHFLVARRCGMIVETFSIGFGPALWKRKVNGITYKIGCIPFGGYVTLPQMDPGAAAPAGPGAPGAAAPRELPRVAPWKKILVALAGAFGNMVLAVILAYVVYWGGQSFAPVGDLGVIGYVETNSMAWAEGLRMGDRLAAVDGKPIRTWDEFTLHSALNGKTNVVLTVQKVSGATQDVTLASEELLGARYVPGLSPYNHCYILKVEPDSSAARAGLRPRDKIVELNGIRLFSREHLMDVVDAHRDQLVPAVVERDGKTLQVQVQPRYSEKAGRALIGIMFNTFDVKTPGAQIKSHAMLIVRLLRALVTPGEARTAAGAVGGPVAILQMFWLYVQTSLIMALWFTGLLNVNLAIMNLLPIPILDGGHVIFAAWEWITRRPLSQRVLNALVNVFMVLLIGLFVLLTWRDIGRWTGFSSAQKKAAAAAAAVTNAPAAPADVSP